MTFKNTPVSIAAVAKHAGVSVATVSRVMNDMDSVRTITRDKVLASAVPPIARAVATTDAEIQTLSFPNISSPLKLGRLHLPFIEGSRNVVHP